MRWLFPLLITLIFSIKDAKAFAAIPDSSPEMTLKIQYEVQCDPEDQESFPGITAEFRLSNRTLRVHLFRYEQEAEVSLGTKAPTSAKDLVFHFLPSRSCKLIRFEPEIQSEVETDWIRRLAQENSPFLVIRPDQFKRPGRDISLGIAYSVFRDDGGFRIRYTYFFSNETTTGPFTTSKPTSLGSYGRRTDIEWIYEVSFNQQGEALSRHYQGGIIAGAGHATHSFRGRFLENSHHPILYNITKHNVFSDRPFPGIQYFRTTGYHLIPREELTAPEARETWMWRHPWTFEISDRELRRNGTLSHPSQEYLYVKVSGELNGGKIRITAKIDGQKNTVVAGEGKGVLKKLGQDLFEKETYSAIHLGQNLSKKHGKVMITRSTKKVSLSKEIRFYRLISDLKEGFRVLETTPQFRCSSAYRCEF
jgi:hypothetical protein